jgi:hypothetical protein
MLKLFQETHDSGRQRSRLIFLVRGREFLADEVPKQAVVSPPFFQRSKLFCPHAISLLSARLLEGTHGSNDRSNLEWRVQSPQRLNYSRPSTRLAPDHRNENTGHRDADNEQPNTKMQYYGVHGSLTIRSFCRP